jgi:hypothetical protein
LEKTIVVLTGNARGGEKTWNSMYNNLLDPYNADLALCFGYDEQKSSSLYSRAKYVWEIPEYDKWEDYYIENLGEGWWKKSFELGSNTGFSGLYGTYGSGAIYAAFKHYLLNYKKEILLEYDRIIITRSDYFYINPQPILSNEFFWAPTGEDYGGICDRYHSFPSKDISIALGIVDYYINTEYLMEDLKENYPWINLESSYYHHFKRNNYINKVKRFPRVQLLVKTETDSTRWGCTNTTLPYNEDLFIKYQSEYDECMKTIFTSYDNFIKTI